MSILDNPTKGCKPTASSNDSTTNNMLINTYNKLDTRMDISETMLLDAINEFNTKIDNKCNIIDTQFEETHSKFDAKLEENTSFMNTTFEENTSSLEKKIHAKCEETATLFDSKLQKLLVTQTAELCHDAKHIADQHEAFIDDIKITMDDLRDEILQSTPKQAYIYMHSKSTSSLPSPNTKWKLSNVKSLDTKALHIHLDNLKLS